MKTSWANFISRAAGKLRLEVRRLHGRLLLASGAAARTEPLCPDYGGSRGKPVDRYYIEAFLAQHAGDIRGRVLEIGDDTYSRRFGGDRVTRQDVLHVKPGAKSTIVGDLSRPGVLPEAAFDCIILTQTLQLIFDMQAAVEQLQRALRPGGVALITAPGISAIDRFEWKDAWCWTVTKTGLRGLLERSFSPAQVEVVAYGNLYAATTFLHGASLQEVNRRKLDAVDEAYPVVVAARAVA